MNCLVKKFVTNRWKENGYILHNDAREALIIDPGGEPEQFIEYLEIHMLSPIAILNTHAHFDHIGAVEELKKKYSALFYLHSDDEKILKSANLYNKLFGGKKMISIPTVDFNVELIGTPIKIGDFTLEIIFTPGHTPGGVCYLFDDNLVTGDTLLTGKVGRIDLPGGDEEALTDSLRRICALPLETIIHPGHGKSSTIGKEIENNTRLAEVNK